MDISLAATAAMAASNAVTTPPRYDALRDFQPLTVVMRIPFMAVVHPAVPTKSVSEFITLAKNRKLSFGSASIGSAAHLAAETFCSLAGIGMTHVPYTGAAPAVADALGGRIDSVFTAIFTTIPHIKSGRLRVLGTSTLKRSLLLPDTPTLSETGVAGNKFSYWTGVAALRGTPRAVNEWLHPKMAHALGKPGKCSARRRPRPSPSSKWKFASRPR